MYATRTSSRPSLNRLTVLLEQRRASGLPVIDLTGSNPTRCGFDYPDREILSALARPASLLYEPDPRGLAVAREAVAADYAARGIEQPADRLLLASGTSEAYAFLFRLLAEPGDRILSPVPSYPLFEHLARLNDLALAPYTLDPERRFAIDMESLSAAAADPRARALLLVNPGNPGGGFLTRGAYEPIVSLCRDRGLPIICDEVFGDYAFTDDPDRVSTLAGPRPVLTFVLNGISKMLGLPQLKVAWIAASGPVEEVREAMSRLDLIADTFLSVNTPVQQALPDLLALRPRIQREIRARLAANLEHLAGRTAPPSPCRVRRPDGGWSAVIEVPRTRSDEEWALRLLDQDGILAHPGYFFDFPGEGRLVVSLLTPADRFAEGVDRMLARVATEA